MAFRKGNQFEFIPALAVLIPNENPLTHQTTILDSKMGHDRHSALHNIQTDEYEDEINRMVG